MENHELGASRSEAQPAHENPRTSGALNEEHLQFLAARKIPIELAVREGLISRGRDLVFPFTSTDGEVLYEKLRGPDKRFRRTPGGTATVPWGLHEIAGANGDTLVWTEGEVDRLTLLAAGVRHVVSVPDGAQGQKSEEIPQDDRQFGWLWSESGELRPEYDRFDKHILAVDNDGPGQALAHNLSIRLGRRRCFVVTYPKGQKDANAVLVSHGVEAVREVIEGAMPLVRSKLAKFGQIPRSPNPVQWGSGWRDLDQHFRLVQPELCVVTGPPNSGKSQWTLALVANLARVHGVRTAIIQFEDTVDRLRDDLERYARAWRHTPDETNRITTPPHEWIDQHFITLQPDEDDEEPDLAWIKDTLYEAVKRHGCQCVVLDPWNELAHLWDKGQTETIYTRNALRQIKKWARQLQLTVIIVVHPTKSAGQQDIDELDLYSVEGSSSWNSKADHGVIVWRKDKSHSECVVKICKSRNMRLMGVPGAARMEFLPNSSSYRWLGQHKPADQK